jgi:hypothetical protein
VPEVPDIKPGDYSIEEEKQKSELDRRIKAADEKKLLKRQQIENLRQKYSALVQQNQKAPAYRRLSAEDFRIDPFLYDILKEQSEKIVREASYATMWAAEKGRVALRKVKQRLVRLMTEESFCVRAIDTDVRVSSFRISSVGHNVESTVAYSTSTLPEAELSGDDTSATHHTESNAGESDTLQSTRSSQSLRRHGQRFGQQSPMKKIVHTADEHTLMRKKRDDRKRMILDLKPPANYSDPADLEAIEVAKATIGDYKLKDHPTYIAPEEDRMNASKKRRQLIAVQNAVSDLKTGFNAKLKNLRDLKERLLITIAETNRELAEIALTIGGSPSEQREVRVPADDAGPPLDLREKISCSRCPRRKRSRSRSRSRPPRAAASRRRRASRSRPRSPRAGAPRRSACSRSRSRRSRSRR